MSFLSIRTDRAFTLRIDLNRAQVKWSRQELAGRALWGAVSPLFRFSPRLCWGWRRFLLRCFKARVGKHVHIDPSARIFIPWHLAIGDWSSIGFDAEIYNLGPLTIGQRVTISQRSHLCGGTHDYQDPSMPLVKSSIHVNDDAWICADAFLCPGVTIGARSIVGARAVVTKDVECDTVVAGNPARVIKKVPRLDAGGPTVNAETESGYRGF